MLVFLHQPGHMPQCTAHGHGNMANAFSGLLLLLEVDVAGTGSQCFFSQTADHNRIITEINLVGQNQR